MPLPFVNGQSETWAPTGGKRVSIAQPFSELEKRQCTIQPTIGLDPAQAHEVRDHFSRHREADLENGEEGQ